MSRLTVRKVNAGRAEQDTYLNLAQKEEGFVVLFPCCNNGSESHCHFGGKPVSFPFKKKTHERNVHFKAGGCCIRVAVAVCAQCPLQNRGINFPVMSSSILYKFLLQTGISVAFAGGSADGETSLGFFFFLPRAPVNCWKCRLRRPHALPHYPFGP